MPPLPRGPSSRRAPPRRWRPLILALLLASPSVVEAAPERDKLAPPLILITHAPASRLAMLGPAEKAIRGSRRFRVLLLQSLLPLMRQDDGERAKKAGALYEKGRNAFNAMDRDRAHAMLTEAAALYDRSFVRHYDPRDAAMVQVWLAQVALSRARPDQARKAFVQAIHLDRKLSLGPHYSPQIRAEFASAKNNLPPSPAPTAEELGRITNLARARAALVLDVRPAGQVSAVQGQLYLATRKQYVAGAPESKIVDPTAPGAARSMAELGQRLRKMAEAHFPAPAGDVPLPRISELNPDLELDLPVVSLWPEARTPWYLRWYTLVAAGAVVAALAVILPVTLTNQHVTGTMTW